MTAATPGFTIEEMRDDRQQIERHRELDERVNTALIQGDLSKLSPNEKRAYYLETCRSLGLNPLTKPFEYLRLNGKEILYARKDCTEQLRQIHQISMELAPGELVEGIYVVRAKAVTPAGRKDEDTGAVAIDGLKGEARANAMMKATTKAKRRVTLSICGLGMLDESEVEDVPEARHGSTEPASVQAALEIAAMHEARIGSAATLEELRQVGEAIAADKERLDKSKLAYLRAKAKQRKEEIASRRNDTEPPPAAAAAAREPGEEG
jgi:hypothetical protein